MTMIAPIRILITTSSGGTSLVLEVRFMGVGGMFLPSSLMGNFQRMHDTNRTKKEQIYWMAVKNRFNLYYEVV